MVAEYVGVDLHRRRSVIVRLDQAGEMISEVRIANDPMVLAAEIGKGGSEARVVLEATYGWYWAVDLIQAMGIDVHLANPLGLNWGNRRRKDDRIDARDLADLLRLGRLPESWIAPSATRELRELVRYRSKLVSQRTSCEAQVHSVLAKEGVAVAMNDLFEVAGNLLLDELQLGDVDDHRSSGASWNRAQPGVRDCDPRRRTRRCPSDTGWAAAPYPSGSTPRGSRPQGRPETGRPLVTR